MSKPGATILAQITLFDTESGTRYNIPKGPLKEIEKEVNQIFRDKIGFDINFGSSNPYSTKGRRKR